MQKVGCVPPALLWCFACLSVEPQEEPAVTFGESDACIGEYHDAALTREWPLLNAVVAQHF